MLLTMHPSNLSVLQSAHANSLKAVGPNVGTNTSIGNEVRLAGDMEVTAVLEKWNPFTFDP